jgi:hypothetical protein
LSRQRINLFTRCLEINKRGITETGVDGADRPCFLGDEWHPVTGVAEVSLNSNSDLLLLTPLERLESLNSGAAKQQSKNIGSVPFGLVGDIDISSRSLLRLVSLAFSNKAPGRCLVNEKDF